MTASAGQPSAPTKAVADCAKRADADEERENLRAEDQAVDHRRGRGGFGHHAPERAAAELAAPGGKGERAEGADRRGFGVGEDAEIEPAHHHAEQDADRDAAPRCFAEFPRFPFAHLRRRPRRNADIDHHSDEIEQDGEDGGPDRGDEQLTDRRLGEQRKTMIGPEPGGTIGPSVPPAAQQPVASAGE